ncbi:cob(I)yrinic acid a,c-diamide adenosyltransferase [Hansschlegelia plantiphila]|uniref:Corrinoid adenosyltransferase n=1 Tax=Hansschlegelia plantiphila TaxID=374655 RepID=A0A9W6J1E2_9HYPH|nr:cob(I)yrinic acid a,c-diamide adenosyltransferase [Hansschlegelia plantiphila]GLK67514.1 cob(I)alamin adenosyltransferase/cobinamide ATP-dependent adenosyltransferase [Hansschlegelia plantiphila]
MTTEDPARHAEKMKARKAHQDKIVSERQSEKGLLIVHTGKGKGKSTAAFGMAMRAIAHGMKVGVVQFIKGPWESGERDLLRRFPDQVEVHAMGEGFTWETQDRERDVKAAREAWEMSKRFIDDPDVKLVILDELNIVLRYDYLDLQEVLAALKNRPADCHVVVTGRNAKDEMIELADLVTEMTQVKHPFRDGVKAQAGIEF